MIKLPDIIRNKQRCSRYDGRRNDGDCSQFSWTIIVATTTTKCNFNRTQFQSGSDDVNKPPPLQIEPSMIEQPHQEPQWSQPALTRDSLKQSIHQKEQKMHHSTNTNSNSSINQQAVFNSNNNANPKSILASGSWDDAKATAWRH